MHMTLQQLLREKGMSRYQLSKASGIPWRRCRTSSPQDGVDTVRRRTLGKLSAALGGPPWNSS